MAGSESNRERESGEEVTDEAQDRISFSGSFQGGSFASCRQIPQMGRKEAVCFDGVDYPSPGPAYRSENHHARSSQRSFCHFALLFCDSVWTGLQFSISSKDCSVCPRP